MSGNFGPATVAARRIDPDVWTKERFLAWDEARPDDGRYEFDGFQPVPMAPATLAHNDIGRNIRESLRAKLPANMGCSPYGPQQPIETVGGAIREPDAFIACSARHAGSVAISAPVIVFEVLSPGGKIAAGMRRRRSTSMSRCPLYFATLS
jgi:Uma2 family endonuclease